MKKILRLMIAASMVFTLLTATVFAVNAAENGKEKISQTLDSDKYQHEIDMDFLSDYTYGGKKTTDGEEINLYVKVPTEWVRL